MGPPKAGEGVDGALGAAASAAASLARQAARDGKRRPTRAVEATAGVVAFALLLGFAYLAWFQRPTSAATPPEPGTPTMRELGSKLDGVAKDVGDVRAQQTRMWEVIGKQSTETRALGDKLDAKIDAKSDALSRRIDGLKDR